MNENYLGFLFLGLTLLGFYSAYLYGHKTRKFRWDEYFAIIIYPILGTIGFAYFVDGRIFILFLVSSVLGFALEYVVGRTYHLTLNERLWKYKRMSISGYTSILSIPIWGAAGVIFWFAGKIIGL